MMIARLHASFAADPDSMTNRHYANCQKGSMAQLGLWKGVVDTANLEQDGAKKAHSKTISGLAAFLLWCVACVRA